MKQTFKILLLILSLAVPGAGLFAQQETEIDRLIGTGVQLHDKGDYDGAIIRYDSALQIDKDNMIALTEKAMSQCASEKYEEAIATAKRAIEKHPEDKQAALAYLSYGNALDGLKRTEDAIEVYDEAIKQFPNHYQLYFNKGVSLSTLNKNEAAIACLQKAVVLNPNHASSHNGIALLVSRSGKRIPAMLAYCRFLILEPKGKRAALNLGSLRKLVKLGVEIKNDHEVSLTIPQGIFADTTKEGKPKENSFTMADLMLTMGAALRNSEVNKDKTEVEEFIRQFTSTCSILKESKKDNYGFYWDYYVPYYTEMQSKGLIEPFAYLVFASSNDPTVSKWLRENDNEVEKFLEWSQSYKWSSL